MSNMQRRTVKPAVLVMITGLVVDFESLGFNCDLYTKSPRQRKFHKLGGFSGNISPRLRDFFTKPMKRYETDENGVRIKDENGRYIWTGKTTTGFQKYCEQNGITFEPNEFDEVLQSIQFTTHNTSEDFWANPFKMILDEQFGTARLTLVMEKPLDVRETYDPRTGKVEKTFRTKMKKLDSGKLVFDNFKKSEYVRFIHIVNKNVPEPQEA